MEAKDTVVGLATLVAMGIDIEIMSINSKDDGIKALRKHLLTQTEISFKAGAEAMFKLMMDDTYTRVEFHKDKYPEFLAQLKEWGIK